MAKRGRLLEHDGGFVVDDSQHAACVDAWLKRSAKDLSSEALLALFESALGALWARTQTTLGEVTLTAIADRVLHNASEKFPFLSSLRVEPTQGIQCGELRGRPVPVRASEQTEGIRFVLVEFLTVLGNLTAEILSPELHAALSNVEGPGAVRVEKREQSNPISSQGTEGEDKGS